MTTDNLITITSIDSDQGSIAGGNTVIITGTGFTSTPQLVFFNGANSTSITLISDTQISALVPPGSKNGKIDVKISINSIWSNVLTYTYSAPVVTGASNNSGSLSGDTQVTITGQYFTGASLVQFGTAAAKSFTVISDTEISALSPAASLAATVDVQVSVNGFASTGSAAQFTYFLPVITSVTNNSGYTSGGTEVTINGQFFTGAAAVKFGTIASTNFNIISDTEINATSPASSAAGIVDITVEVQGQSSVTSSADQFKYTTPTLTITFTNDTNGNFPDSQVLIGFFDGNAPALPTAQPSTPISYTVPNPTFRINNVADASVIQPLQLSSNFNNGWPHYGYPFTGNWYSLSQLSEGVSVTNFSGRIYVVYSQLDGNGNTFGWQFPSFEAGGWGYTPDSSGYSSPDFYIRYDQMELTFNGTPNDVADLTSINFWSIPMSISTSLNGNPVSGNSVTGLYNGATADSIQAALSNLTEPPTISPNGTGEVPGNFQPDANTTYLSTAPYPFARVIGPVSYPASGKPASPYDNFSDYLTYLQNSFGPGTAVGTTIPTLGNGTFAFIAGNFAGSACKNAYPAPCQPQSYSLTASIDSDSNITLTGTVGGNSVTITFSNADLTTPPGIYGGNVPATITPSPYTNYPSVPGNDVYGWIAGDLFLGFNIGAIGSNATSGTDMVGSIPSNEWYNLTSLYQDLQPDNPYYNRWSATLQDMAQAYNFAYSDRLKQFVVLVKLSPGLIDTMNVSLSDVKKAGT